MLPVGWQQELQTPYNHRGEPNAVQNRPDGRITAVDLLGEAKEREYDPQGAKEAQESLSSELKEQAPDYETSEQDIQPPRLQSIDLLRFTEPEGAAILLEARSQLVPARPVQGERFSDGEAVEVLAP